MTARYWPRLSSSPPRAAPGGNCRRSSVPPGRRSTAASPTGPRPGYGPSCTGWCWTDSAGAANWTGRAARSTRPVSGRSTGGADWTESDRSRQARVENPRHLRPQRAADLGGYLRGQPPRQPGPDPADARHPAGPLPLRAPAPSPGQTPRGQGLRLRPPARLAAPSTDRATHRPPRHRAVRPSGRHRWVVERTVSWLNGCRRLHRRYERTAEHFLAFVGIASALICYRRLIR